MTRLIRVTPLVVALLTLACWVLMFLAGTDVWHDLGRPDVIARLSERGATPFDMRAFATAFYGLFFLLIAQVIVSGFAAVRRQ